MEKRYLLGPSGGTAPSMGTYMKVLVGRRFIDEEIFLVPEMWRTMAGLTGKTVIKADIPMVRDWDRIGGSPIIPSCKNTNVFKIKQGDGTIIDKSEEVRKFCEGYEGIIAVGGGGTTLQCQQLMEEKGIKSIVALATMDNDILTFDNVLGSATAVVNSGESIIAAVNDAMTMNRPTIIYIMGYDCGRLAVNATKYAQERLKNYGKVDLLHIPETQISDDELSDIIKERYKGGAFTVVISQGCCEETKITVEGEHKEYDTKNYTKRIEKSTGIKFKQIDVDYRCRSGAPVSADIFLATRFAEETTNLIDEGNWNYVIGSINGDVVVKPIEEVAETIRTQNRSSKWYATFPNFLCNVREILAKK